MSETREDDVTDERPAGDERSRARPGRAIDTDRPCMNCGDPTPGEYCPSCGQRKVGVRVSVRTLVMDVLEDQFILDRRLPRTLSALLFQPGRLTVEHIDGRIVRYIHPFRLYLVTSLLFFLLLSFFSLQLVRRAVDGDGDGDGIGILQVEDGGSEDLRTALADVQAELADSTLTGESERELRREEAALLQRLRTARMDSLRDRVSHLDEGLAEIDAMAADSAIPGPVREAVLANRAVVERQREVAVAQLGTLEADTVLAAAPDAPGEEQTLAEMFDWGDDPPTVNITPFPGADSALVGQVRHLGTMTPGEALESLVGTFFNYVPTLMFILLPVFAAVLKLLYIRRGRYYAEHFVFLLHVHSVVFILATVMLLLRTWVPGWVEALLVVWILVYILLAMKRVYAQGWVKTFFKYWTLGWMYFWILVITMPFALLATVLLI